MGAEISEQDSEKLRKDAFHPGGDAALKGLHKMQKKKIIPAVHANWREFPSKDPGRGSGEWCVKGTWEGQMLQQVLHWQRLSHALSCLCHHRLLLSPHPPLWASWEDLGLTSTQDWGCPKKRHRPLLSGCRCSGRTSISIGV